MTRTAFVVALLLSAPAAAQTLPPAPADYALIGALDVPVENLTTTRANFRVSGWIFECRSGLQPFTQRLGNVTLRFFRGGTSFFPPKYDVEGNIMRADVPPYFTPQCPSVGPYVGFNVTMPTYALPPQGTWELQLWWWTTDGAGRVIWHNVNRTVTFID